MGRMQSNGSLQVEGRRVSERRTGAAAEIQRGRDSIITGFREKGRAQESRRPLKAGNACS